MILGDLVNDGEVLVVAFGGRGGLLGTIAGVLIIQVLSTMVVLIGLEIETQFIIKGLVILAAVTLYGLAQKKDS